MTITIYLYHFSAVLFTVEAEQTLYVSEFGGDVVMGCSFQPKPANPAADLKVTWHRMTSGAAQEVYQMVNGEEHSTSPEYQGRVKLLTEELKDGWAKLQVRTGSDVFRHLSGRW